MSKQNIENFIPPIQSDGLNTKTAVDFSSASSLSLPTTVTASASSSLTVGATPTIVIGSTPSITVGASATVVYGASASVTYGTSSTLNIGSSGVIAGVGTGTTGILLKNLKNSANATVGGTAKTITIDIAGTNYYFLVYPTSST